MDLDIVSGAGSVVSNVLDYAKWLKMMIDSSGPISITGHNDLRTGRTVIQTDSWLPSPFTGPLVYTLGWFSGVYKGHEFYYHSGGMEAFGAEVIFFPALKYGITLFGNTAMTSNIAESILMFHLVDEKLKTPQSQRFDWSKRHVGNNFWLPNVFGLVDYRTQKQFTRLSQNDTTIYYPDLPNPRLAPTLPLLNYTGTYYNPGYQNITIFLKDGILAANRTDAAVSARQLPGFPCTI